MTLIAAPPDESERQALLHTSKLLDAEVTPAFDALTRLVASQLDCPMAMINLIDAHRVWAMAKVGIDLRQLSRDDSFCGATIRQNTPLVVTDTAQDKRFKATPLVTGETKVRFYIGVPLMVQGHALGTVCAMDTQPRTLSDASTQVLKDLALAASALVESHINAQRFRKQEARVRTATLASSDWLWETDDQGVIQWVSASFAQHTSLSPSSEVGLTFRDLYMSRDDETRVSWDRFVSARSKRQPFYGAIADRITPRGQITVSISGTPVFNRAGRFMGYRGASRNITQQIAEENRSREADLLLRQAIESFNAGVMISAPDGRIRLCNTSWRQRFGIDATNDTTRWPDLLRKRIAAGLYPDAIGREAEFFQWRMNMVELSEPQEIRVANTWVLSKDHRLPDGSVVHFSMDISETKRHAAALAVQTQALTASEERLSAVLGSLPDLWFVLDAQGRHVAGHEEHPLLFNDIKGKTQRSDASKALANAQATGEPQRLDYSLSVGGKLRHFEARLAPMPDKHTLFLTRDMTERIEAAEQLRVSEELYRSVAATISDGLIVVDLDGRVAAINPAACRIYGVQPHELTRLTATDALPYEILSDDLSQPLPRAQWPIIEAIQTRVPIEERLHPVRHRDGSVFWIRISCHPLSISAEAQPFAVVATFRDITHERLASQALALSEERWKFALDGAGDGVWDWDPTTNRVFYSPRWKAMLGHEDAEISDSMDEFALRIHPTDRRLVSKALAGFLRHEQGLFQAEFRMRHKQGHDIWILSRGKIVSRDSQGQPLRVVGTHSDITPIKHAAQILREKQSAEAASAAKSEFLSRMSHEIRTPLNAVNGFGQLLKLQLKAMPGATQHLNYVDQILHGSEHLMGLINDVLDLQKVEAGILTLKMEPLALHDKVQQCMDMLSPLAQQHDITLKADIDPHHHVQADGQRLRQILMNIGSNAIKYNQPGGSVRLYTEQRPGGSMALVIKDTGPGMSRQQLGRLFQPFERLGRETTSIEGSGLGLIITRSLIEAMGGSMEIQSQPGSGTRVDVVLSPASTSNPNDAGQQPADLPALKKTQDVGTHREPTLPLHVLYVEDNRINAMLFEEALRPYSQLSLDIAEDGQMALDMARDKNPDVLVLDAHLPGMSGFDVLKALRTDLPHLASTPAYMCSADAMPDDLARAKAAGFVGYWTKPIDIGHVTTVLCELADKGDSLAP
ncbi:MAG: PAS domain S-box protein [Burkholderiales bacterium]|nr:PAS domain S-box protein [Burkholderiales bacterium]